MNIVEVTGGRAGMDVEEFLMLILSVLRCLLLFVLGVGLMVLMLLLEGGVGLWGMVFLGLWMLFCLGVVLFCVIEEG